MAGDVYIRGVSIICSLGERIDEIISRVERGEVRVDEIPLELTNMPYTRPYYRIKREGKPCDFGSEEYFYEVLFDTIEAALSCAGLGEKERRRLPIFFGSTSIDIPIYESRYQKSEPSVTNLFSHASPGYGRIAGEIARRIGSRGACYTFTTACTSSANAVLYASAMMKQGLIDRALVIGYDLFNNLGFYGFESLRLISPNGYRPFDKNRAGIIMGESCAAVLLDREGRPGDFRVLGGANLCDTFNVTTHTLEGDFIARVILRAMENAGLSPQQIDAVKAHATGSDLNDRTEANGMRRAFGEHIPPVTGLKPYIGHTVGACGVAELVIFTESVKRGFIPATPGFSEPDEEIGITPITKNLSIREGSFMLNYFGFGGNCTSLVVSNRS